MIVRLNETGGWEVTEDTTTVATIHQGLRPVVDRLATNAIDRITVPTETIQTTTSIC